MAIPTWAVDQFGGVAVRLPQLIVDALTEAHRRGLIAQEGASLKTKHAYGGAWTAKYELLVEALGALPGAEVFHPHGAHFELVKLNGAVLLPFRHATSLAVPIAEARVTAKVPVKLADKLQPRLPDPTLFDTEEELAVASMTESIDLGTPIVYIGFVCNVDSDRLLGAWWGLAPDRAEDGRLRWNPDPLPLQVGRSGLAAVPSGGQPGFDQGEIPAANLTPRATPVDVPLFEAEPQGTAAADRDE